MFLHVVKLYIVKLGYGITNSSKPNLFAIARFVTTGLICVENGHFGTQSFGCYNRVNIVLFQIKCNIKNCKKHLNVCKTLKLAEIEK